MSTVSIKHYNVKIGMSLQGFEGCCGITSIYNFFVEGDDSVLTPKQVADMYDALLLKMLRESNRGIYLATDAIPEYMMDESSAWFSSTCTRGEAMSLVGYCRHHKFAESAPGFNTNTGNSVATFTYVARAPIATADEIDLDEHKTEWGDTQYDDLYEETPKPKAPTIEDELKPAPVAGAEDATAILEAVRVYIANLEQAA